MLTNTAASTPVIMGTRTTIYIGGVAVSGVGLRVYAPPALDTIPFDLISNMIMADVMLLRALPLVSRHFAREIWARRNHYWPHVLTPYYRTIIKGDSRIEIYLLGNYVRHGNAIIKTRAQTAQFKYRFGSPSGRWTITSKDKVVVGYFDHPVIPRNAIITYSTNIFGTTVTVDMDGKSHLRKDRSHTVYYGGNSMAKITPMLDLVMVRYFYEDVKYVLAGAHTATFGLAIGDPAVTAWLTEG